MSTEDGRQQLGVMLNELFAPPAVIDAYFQAWAAIGARLLEAAPSGLASTSASLPTAVRVGKVAP